MASKEWRIRSASVPGSSHLARGLECQDAHTVSVLPDGTLLAAVCDGAGSARRAAEGSQIAARETVAFLRQNLLQATPSDIPEWEHLLGESIRHARSCLSLSQQSRGKNNFATSDCDIDAELATTVLLAVVTDCWCSIMQIGDGAIVTRGLAGELSVESVLDNNEYINETTFITSPHYLECIHCRVFNGENLTGIALLSDGMQLLSIEYPSNRAHAQFFGPLFDFAAQADSTNAELDDFLRSERVCERTDDDKTFVLAVRM